jgi:hypothetical protein
MILFRYRVNSSVWIPEKAMYCECIANVLRIFLLVWSRNIRSIANFPLGVESSKDLGTRNVLRIFLLVWSLRKI